MALAAQSEGEERLQRLWEPSQPSAPAQLQLAVALAVARGGALEEVHSAGAEMSAPNKRQAASEMSALMMKRRQAAAEKSAQNLKPGQRLAEGTSSLKLKRRQAAAEKSAQNLHMKPGQRLAEGTSSLKPPAKLPSPAANESSAMQEELFFLELYSEQSQKRHHDAAFSQPPAAKFQLPGTSSPLPLSNLQRF